MTVTDSILFLSAIIVVAGWFANAYLNRRHEMTKRRIDHRVETLKGFLSFYIEAQHSKSLNGFNDVQVLFLLYGYNDEIALIEQIATIVTTNPNDPKWLALLHELNVLVRKRLREQLNLPKVKQ